jgi:AcrR family transcriptional regulator
LQYKKEELKAIIIEKAENEFLQKGYENASLRRIAKESGTTIGNLYHYFENKEALFDELVKNAYISFLHLINHHSEIDIPQDISDKNDISIWRVLLFDYLGQIMPVFTKRFLLMLDMSSGTKYENAKNKFIDILEQHFVDHISDSNKSVSIGFARVIAVQLLYGILYIIRNYDENEIKRQLICDILLFNIAGIMQLINE